MGKHWQYGHGRYAQDEAWILFSLGLAKKYIKFVCGEAPIGSRIGVMWHDHEFGSYPSIGVWSDYERPWDYINACERALEVFNRAMSWYEVKQYYEEQAFSEEDVADSTIDQ